jgi:enoyl-[acyl-carrier-protein] reductase (NADH)
MDVCLLRRADSARVSGAVLSRPAANTGDTCTPSTWLVDQFAQEAAIKRITTVEEVAAVAVLLASEAGAGITGSMYNVDGGTAAW